MVQRATGDIDNNILKDHVESLQQEKQENIIILSAAPTATEPLLEDNQHGVFGGVKYERKANTIYVYTPSSTITIT